MTDLLNNISPTESPQCQYFVVRKKRLCRMTVRSGRQYCGEHEPQPKTKHEENDTRIPCPNDPKHTCYASKLQKHLSICNARATEFPPYIVPNINVVEDEEPQPRVMLSKVPESTLKTLIDKINVLYEKYCENNIETFPEHPIHPSVLSDFKEEDRTENSRRHLRQVSSLLWIAEKEDLVQPGTCYVELGAGKGHLSYYAYGAWCAAARDSRVLLLDRAALRHKRDNKLRAPAPATSDTDARDSVHVQIPRSKGEGRTGSSDLLKLVDVENSEANSKDTDPEQTPGSPGPGPGPGPGAAAAGAGAEPMRLYDRLVRAQRRQAARAATPLSPHYIPPENMALFRGQADPPDLLANIRSSPEAGGAETDAGREARAQREVTGRRAKALLDWARVLYLRERGFDARLCRYVSPTVSPENVCIVAKRTVD